MIEQEEILTHLTLYQRKKSGVIVSGFMAGMRDARASTGRDPKTGRKKTNINHGSWLGAIGYLILLDQIGTCFKPKTSPVLPERRAILKALQYFERVTEPEMHAIYALRHSFAHNYGLYNVRSSPPHLFGVCVGAWPLVTMPQVPWEGIGDPNLNGEKTTWVNLEALGDLVERIYERLLELAKADELELTLSGGVSELRDRFSYATPFIGVPGEEYEEVGR